ncbi:MAG: branched chain amino acid aminotransferase, partial [Alphaproteobacteria bacterium]|nr:branched chain amino acid aminotransferase [Alphaproteobacteria bacterium]
MDVEQTSRFTVTPSPRALSADEREQLLADPGFGRIFTDHMVTIRYADGRGWHDATVTARGPISIDPACSVLHYAQEIFE